MGEVLGEMEVDHVQQPEKVPEVKPRNHIVESKKYETDKHPLGSEEEIDELCKHLSLFKVNTM